MKNICRLAAVLVASSWCSSIAVAQQPHPPQWPQLRADAKDLFGSDGLALLLPSRAKTFVNAGYDPDDRPESMYRGNDDGFSGQNLCESYRDRDQDQPLAVLAHFEGRAGVMGLFFRNFWSGFAGVPYYPGEHNRTRIWLDGRLTYDMPLTDYFRNPGDPGGQVAPFDGPFTRSRSGGHVTHAPLCFQDSFKLGVWDDAFQNAARFHRVAVTLATPEGELRRPDPAEWARIAGAPGQWPHRTPRRPMTAALQLAGNGGTGLIDLAGPATLLEVSCEVSRHEDWSGLWARFTWDDQSAPAVDVPLRVLGGLAGPPHRFPMQSLLLGNDGDRRTVNWFPMPFASRARLQFENRNGWPVTLRVTYAGARGAYPGPWGHFHATWHRGVTRTGETFQGPRLHDARGELRMLMLEDVMDSSGRIPDQHMTHLEGDLCVRINGNRGADHSFDASETSIGRWGWYLSPADRPFVSDTSFQSSILLQRKGEYMEALRLMGSMFLFDPVHFVSGLEIVLEHGVHNDSNADYGLVSFLYVDRGAARRTVHEIDIGDGRSESNYSVRFDESGLQTVQGSFLRDQFFGTAPVTDTVRSVSSWMRFRIASGNATIRQVPIGLGLRLDRLGTHAARVMQADVLVDGAYAGLLHVANHSPVFPWLEGNEAEVELPLNLTAGKNAFEVEIRPRPGSDPVQIARIWVYEYGK